MNAVVGPAGIQKTTLGRKILRGLGIFVVLFVILFVAAVIWRMPIVAEQDRSVEVVKQIEASRLTLADADGSRLPPGVDEIQANATVEGVDANTNGIRDDVELAIYAKYPISIATSSASSTKPVDTNLKLRAAELQYAKALQMYLTSVFTKETLVAVINQDDRALACMGDALPQPAHEATDDVWREFFASEKRLKNDVEALVFNTAARSAKQDEVFKQFMTTYGSENGNHCDF